MPITGTAHRRRGARGLRRIPSFPTTTALMDALAVIASLLLLGLPARPSDEPPPRTGLEAGRAPSTAPASAPVADTTRIRLTVETRSDAGLLFCALWRGREGYPTERDRALREGVVRTLRARRGAFLFESLADGHYAIACFHDENGNRMLDTHFFGIPSEGTGASNGARSLLGPPTYDDARFHLSTQEPLLHLLIRIAY